MDFIGLLDSKAHMNFVKIVKNQKLGSVTKGNMMPLNPILGIEMFDYWGVDLMDSFPPFFGFVCILVAIDYVSEWIEAISCLNSDSKSMIKFLKENLLSRIGIPQAIISDRGKYYCNKSFESSMKKYGSTHKCYPLSFSNKWSS